MEFFIGWLIFSLVVGVAASSRGRSLLRWTFLSMALSPLVGLILVLVFPSRRQDFNVPTPETHVRCLECKELVLREARKCKHCACSLVPQ